MISDLNRRRYINKIGIRSGSSGISGQTLGVLMDKFKDDNNDDKTFTVRI